MLAWPQAKSLAEAGPQAIGAVLVNPSQSLANQQALAEAARCRQRASLADEAVKSGLPSFRALGVVEVRDGRVTVEACDQDPESAIRKAAAKIVAHFGTNRASSLESVRVDAVWENGFEWELPDWSARFRSKRSLRNLNRALPAALAKKMSFATRLAVCGDAFGGAIPPLNHNGFEAFICAACRAAFREARHRKMGLYEWICAVLGRRRRDL